MEVGKGKEASKDEGGSMNIADGKNKIKRIFSSVQLLSHVRLL